MEWDVLVENKEIKIVKLYIIVLLCSVEENGVKITLIIKYKGKQISPQTPENLWICYMCLDEYLSLWWNGKYWWTGLINSFILLRYEP